MAASRGKMGLPILGQVAKPVERADAARNRTAILDAARKLLKKRSIDSICMDELALAAGVGKGTLYRRFADRSSLCRALLDESATELQNRVLAGFGLPHFASHRVRLEHLLDALFDFVAEHAPLLSEAAAFERGKLGRFDHPAHTWQRDAVRLHLLRGAEQGELPSMDPSTTADFILAPLDPDLIRWHLRQGVTAETLKGHYRDFWRRALALTG